MHSLDRCITLVSKFNEEQEGMCATAVSTTRTGRHLWRPDFLLIQMRRISVMRQVFASLPPGASCGLAFRSLIGRRLLVMLFFGIVSATYAAEDVTKTVVVGSDFQSAREALVEAIEAEGLVVSAIIPFNDMLARTAGDLEKISSPFTEAAIVQFCSSVLAWQLLEEEASQIALCPLSVAVYVRRAEPGQVTLAYRSPGNTTAGRIKAEKLLIRLVNRSAELARLRW